ncbi:MAG: alpha-L-fucosidase, partial [Bacteroidia bacterium]|nr:alpha-L-fucosidase [Bacteroidia bacterium]
MKKTIFLSAILFLIIACSPKTEQSIKDEATRKQDAKMEWWREARFGMFVHWGLYAVPAGEWNGEEIPGISEWIMLRAKIPVAEYEKLAEQFNPEKFDAEEWVRLAKLAGMKYIIITSKHHDGFAMFHSAASHYNIVDATPFGRDPLKELAEACQAEGVRLGFYYSQTIDWHEPDAVGNSWDGWPTERDFKRYLRGKVFPQIEELLTHYGPVAGIWFDTPGPITPEESREIVELVHRLQPDCLVNSRIGNGLGDYDTLGDQEIPRLPRPGLWETPDTHNDTWAFSHFDTSWKSARELV